MLTGLIALAVVLVAAAAASAQDDAATDQRVVRLVSDYELQDDLGRIDVVEEITVSNVRGNSRSGNTITSYFWTGHTVWLPADADNVSISVEGTELEWEVVDTIDGYDVISADYRRNLNFGQTRVIDVTYSLPTYGPEQDFGRRINEAFFFFDMVICCGFEEVTLTFSAPSEFIVTPPSDFRFDSTVSGGRQQFTFADNEVTGQFTDIIFVDWFGFDDNGMERTTASVGGATVELSYPPDDPSWAADTSADVEALSFTLEELIGSPFPVDDLTVRQGRNDDFDRWGVEGPFDEAVTIPRDYNRLGVATTLARAWLADGPFAEGTVRDGLAFEFAAEAVTRNGGTITAPGAPTSSAVLGNEGAHWVMRQVAEDIGHDGLTEILQMAERNETAYTGGGEPEQVATVPDDWRRFLDLAEQRLGSDTVANVFEEHVIEEAGAAELAQRSTALSAYRDLDSAVDVPMPVGIRTAMTNWEFDEAQAMLTAAQGVVAERDRIVGADESRATDDGLALGEGWEQAGSVEDLEAVQAALVGRESELDRAGLIRLALIGLGVLVVAVALVGGVLYARRRKTVDAATDGPAVIDLTGAPPHQPITPSGPPAAASPAAAPYTPVIAPPLVASQHVSTNPALVQDPSQWAPPVPAATPAAGAAAPYTDATIQVSAPLEAPVIPPPVEILPPVSEPADPAAGGPSGPPMAEPQQAPEPSLASEVDDGNPQAEEEE